MVLRMLRPTRALLIALLATACSGGGGSEAPPPPPPPPPPLTTELTLAVSDETLASSATSGSLTVSLDDYAPELKPALLQFDLKVVPPIVKISATDPLTALQTLETLDGDFQSDGFRIVCGYGESIQSQVLPSGDLFRIELQTQIPRVAGAGTVTVSNLRVVDNEGNDVPLNVNPVTATITVQ